MVVLLQNLVAGLLNFYRGLIMKKLKYVLAAGLAVFALMVCGCNSEVESNADDSGNDNSSNVEAELANLGFVKIAAVSISGTETWKPEVSKVFIKGRVLNIPEYYICNHEVTQKEFTSVMGENPSNTEKCFGDAENNPVNSVTWYMAIAYCNKRSLGEGLKPCYTVDGVDNWATLKYRAIPTSSDDKWNAATCDFTKNGYRLPTEAAWEWAARAEQEYYYSGSYATIKDVGWVQETSIETIGETTTTASHEVMKLAPNGYNLYDMSGNVSEWCWDLYSATLTINDGLAGPSPESVTKRVDRGGNFYSNSGYAKPYDRQSREPTEVDYGYGLRLVRVVK